MLGGPLGADAHEVAPDLEGKGTAAEGQPGGRHATHVVEGTPDSVERHCTDVPCLLALLVAVTALGFLVQYSLQEGSFDRLASLDDGRGRPCGYDAGVADRGFLYFCRNDSGKLDVRRPICSAKCPSSSNTSHAECGGAKDYPTEPYMDMLCRPVLPDDVEAGPHNSPGKDDLVRQVLSYGDLALDIVLARILIERWANLPYIGLIAVTVSYTLIWLLWQCASALVKYGIAFLTVAPLVVGGYFLGLASLLSSVAPPEPRVYRWAGLALLGLGLTFALVACTARRSVNIAVDCIEMSCRCILQMPMLMLHPLIAATVYVGINFAMVYSALLLVSCGHEKLMSDGEVVFVFTLQQRVYIAFHLFMFLWVHQSIFMVSEFVVAYATALWCFHGGLHGQGSTPRFTVARAYWACCRYHLGTCVYGGLAIGLIRPLSLVVGGFFSCARLRGNPLGSVLRTGCYSCTEAFEKWWRPLTKVAYCDVVMNSRPFCSAGRHALSVVSHQDDAVRILNGATWLIQAAGLIAVGAVGAVVVAVYSQGVIHDDSRVTLVTAVGGAIFAMMVALPFAMIFDTVSDTILYCFEVQRQRDLKVRRKEDRHSYCVPCVYRGLTPWALQALAAGGHGGDAEANGPLIERERGGKRGRRAPR